MDATVEYRILGPLEVRVAGIEMTPTAPKQRALLGALLVEANRVVSIDRLIHALWGESPPTTARSALSVHVTELRKRLGTAASHLETRRPGYLLQVDPGATDAERFESLVVAGRTALEGDDHDEGAELLSEADDLWRGPALVDFEYADFAQVEASRLDEIRIAARIDRIGADLERGRHVALVAELEAMTEQEPDQQRPWIQLMLALYRCGRQRDALDAFQRAAAHFAQAGLEPGREMRSLEERILLEDPGLDFDSPPATPLSNLPSPRSSFVGRAADITKLSKLVRDNRLVTVTGPGGVGKTRLALEVVPRLTAEFPGGVRFVDLAQAEDPADVEIAITRSLELEADGKTSLQTNLLDRAPAGAALVVIDSAEHVLEVGAESIAMILNSWPEARVLATSRTALSLTGEIVLPLAPLAIPACEADQEIPAALAEYDGVRLFVERAQAAAPDFSVGEANALAIAEICCRLDGLPLALELAAAQIATLGPTDLIDRLNDSAELPVRPARDSAPRHQTMWETVQWSYRLLDADAQAVFRHASVFAGSFSLQAIEAICSGATMEGNDIARFLTALVEGSMILTVDHDAASRRFALLTTLREFGKTELAKAGEQEATKQRHHEYFIDLATGRPDPGTPGEAEWLERIDNELAEFLAAVSGGFATEPRDTVAAYQAVARFLIDTGRSREAQAMTEHAMGSLDGLDVEHRALVLRTAGDVAFFAGDRQESERLLRQALEERREDGNPREIMAALNSLGISLIRTDRLDDTRACFTEAIAIGEELDDPSLVASPTANLGISYLLGGPTAAAAPHLRTALEILRSTGNELGISIALAWLAADAWIAQDTEYAVELCEESMAIQRRFNARAFVARNLVQRAAFTIDLGVPQTAPAYLEESIALYEATAERLHYSELVETCGYLAIEQGHPAVAAELLGAADARRSRLGISAPLWDRPRRLQADNALRNRLGDAVFETARQRGSVRGPTNLKALIQHIVGNAESS